MTMEHSDHRDALAHKAMADGLKRRTDRYKGDWHQLTVDIWEVILYARTCLYAAKKERPTLDAIALAGRISTNVLSAWSGVIAKHKISWAENTARMVIEVAHRGANERRGEMIYDGAADGQSPWTGIIDEYRTMEIAVAESIICGMLMKGEAGENGPVEVIYRAYKWAEECHLAIKYKKAGVAFKLGLQLLSARHLCSAMYVRSAEDRAMSKLPDGATVQREYDRQKATVGRDSTVTWLLEKTGEKWGVGHRSVRTALKKNNPKFRG